MRPYNKDINIVIPDIQTSFVGRKEYDNFTEILQDFPNAKKVRVLTYTAIYGDRLNQLRNLSEDVDLLKK